MIPPPRHGARRLPSFGLAAPESDPSQVVLTGPPGEERWQLMKTLLAAGYDVRLAESGLVDGRPFLAEVDRELQRPAPSRRGGAVAVIGAMEIETLAARFGPRARGEVAERLAGVARDLGGTCNRLGRDNDGRVLMLLPGLDEEVAARTLNRCAAAVAGTRFVVAGEHVRLTPLIGWTTLDDHVEHTEAVRDARDATNEAARHGDLRPVRYRPWMRGSPPPRRRPWRAVPPVLLPALMLLIGVGVPFGVYLAVDPGPIVSWIVVAALVATAASIVIECLYALGAPQRPAEPARPHPPATAIICAYLPNEAATIVETLESFLRIDYAGELEIILAYNRPHPLPIEDVLLDLARRHQSLRLVPVTGSTSKSQNLNAAIGRARGEFVGVFDADHHPDPDSFTRAWAWLANGYDVVQGHCVVRNGDSSWVAKTVAVEFETIYAVSHPGRTRMFGFGLFGGSNGFWRTDLLAGTRMHGSMLTEDVDSSMRALAAGARIAVDRTIISRELAPTGLPALWHQRSRWAQGRLQVSVRHLVRCLLSPALSLRQKSGVLLLLGWREIQPWLTLQILPVVLYSAWRAGGFGRLDWTVPIFLITLVFTLAAGPVQTWFAWRMAVPELRRRGRWFWRYLLVSGLFYGHFKNLIARSAHMKEALGDRRWRVTPR